MSKQIFDALPKKQQDAIMALGLELEEFGTKEAMADDQKVAEVYAKKGAKVADLDDATVEKWRAIARDTAWKDYAGKTAAVGRTAQARRRRPRLLTRQGVRHLDGSRPRRRRDRNAGGAPRGRRRSCRPHRRARQSAHRASLSSIALRGRRRCVLTYSVVSRYFLHSRPTGRTRLSVFLIVGAVFMSAAAIQARRGHVAHRGDRRPAAAAGEPRAAARWSISRASRSAASSPGNPGRCWMRPGSRISTPARPGDRRSGFPIR